MKYFFSVTLHLPGGFPLLRCVIWGRFILCSSVPHLTVEIIVLTSTKLFSDVMTQWIVWHIIGILRVNHYYCYYSTVTAKVFKSLAALFLTLFSLLDLTKHSWPKGLVIVLSLYLQPVCVISFSLIVSDAIQMAYQMNTRSLVLSHSFYRHIYPVAYLIFHFLSSRCFILLI